MSKIEWKGGALLAPLPPTMVSCGTAEKPNIITVAWTGIVNTKPPKTYISVRPERFSYDLIRDSGEFCINLTPSNLVRAADWCGAYTGRKVDKFKKCRLTAEYTDGFACPMIAESPVSLMCRVTEVIPLGTHDLFLADIESVFVDESLMNESGKLCLSRAHLAALAHGEYFALGRRIGTFGFSVKKKKPPQKKR